MNEQESGSIQEPVELLVGKLQEWLEELIKALPNLVLAILILVVAWFLAKLGRRLILKLMGRISTYRQVNNLLATIGYVTILIVGVIIALGVLNLSGPVATLLGGAGIIGLAVGFATQDIAANFISGILLSIRRPFREDDIIETNDYFGTVHQIDLRATHLRTFQGQIVLIPNKEVFQNPIVNYSRQRERRIDLECGVAYGDDLEEARRVATEAIESLDFLKSSKSVDLYYKEFGSSSINFVVRYWVDFSKQTDYLKAQSEGIISLKKAFDENGITIPFPIRTLDFGVVGGEKLSEVLPPSLYDSTSSKASSSPSSGGPED